MAMGLFWSWELRTEPILWLGGSLPSHSRRKGPPPVNQRGEVVTSWCPTVACLFSGRLLLKPHFFLAVVKQIRPNAFQVPGWGSHWSTLTGPPAPDTESASSKLPELLRSGWLERARPFACWLEGKPEVSQPFQGAQITPLQICAGSVLGTQSSKKGQSDVVFLGLGHGLTWKATALLKSLLSTPMIRRVKGLPFGFQQTTGSRLNRYSQQHVASWATS